MASLRSCLRPTIPRFNRGTDRVAQLYKDAEIAVLLLCAANPGAEDAHLANRVALPQLRLKAPKLGHDLVKRAQCRHPLHWEPERR